MQKQEGFFFEEENVSGTNVAPQIGEMAPSFIGATTKGDLCFPEDYKGKWVILFSHSCDFSPVSTTEYMRLADIYSDLLKHNTEVVGISTDSVYTHIAWINRIYNLSWKGMKFMEILFPIIDDSSGEILKRYGMQNTRASVFLVDPNSMIRAILHYPEEVGRNIEEILRILYALQKSEQEQVYTPADWVEGEDVILKTPNNLQTAKDRMNNYEKNRYCLDWFLCFLQEKKKEK